MPVLFTEPDRFNYDDEFCITLGDNTVISNLTITKENI